VSLHWGIYPSADSPLGHRDKLAYDYPWLADLSREPATGKMFNLHFCYCWSADMI
jgi:hypothetical protein